MAKAATKKAARKPAARKAAGPVEVVKNVEEKTPRQLTEEANAAFEKLSDEDKALHLDDMRARRSALGY